MKRNRSLLVCAALLLGATCLHALDADAWKFRQTVAGTEGGAVRFSLPLSTLDAIQSDLRDLRVVDSAGKEVPYLLIKPSSEPEKTFAPKDFKAELTETETIITLETGTTVPLESIELETHATRFLKPVQIEVSNDGTVWQTLAEGVPVFRQDGATKTTVSLGLRAVAYVRLTLGDERTRPIVITGATLHASANRPAFTEPLTPRITRTDEFAGETVLTLDLGAKNLSLADVEFSAEDSLFARNVTLSVREVQGDQVTERVLARGAIYRVAIDAFTPTADMRVDVHATVPSRELLVHIENGDSPPLHVYRVTAERNPVHLVAAAKKAGDLQLLLGNSLATAPHYDLAGLADELSQLPLSTPSIDEPLDNPGYRQPEALPGMAIEGAPLDVAAWRYHRSVAVSPEGVQLLELDLPALAHSEHSFADLRLIQNGKQVPYVLERTALTREITLPYNVQPDLRRPTVSRWKCTVPQKGLPLVRITLISSTPLFERRIRIFETRSDVRGEPYEHLLAEPTWTHSPTEKPAPLSLEINQRLETDTLWIETDNGDNPAIVLDGVSVQHPIARLLFKSAGTAPVELYYGNTSALAPKYDVALVAPQLLSAGKNPALLGPEVAAPERKSLTLVKGHSGTLFWGALAIVVAILLVVVAKLLPKTPPPDKTI